MRLPPEFTDKVLSFLRDQGISSEGFLESFDEVSPKGIRINRTKADPSSYAGILKEIDPDTEPCEKVPWCDSGFYIGSDTVGNDPYYHAGVFYPQEPSAMLPGQIAGAKPGEKILDLCAAPGGKTCRIGEDLGGQGLLVANEINESRAKALLRNVERMGLSGVVVLNEDPDNLASKLPGFFDKILLDVPCSGEGMFRRDPKAVGSWERFGPSSCIPVQRQILEAAHIMLKAGGEIIYSTCTFDTGEDEEQIASFIQRHPGYKVIPHPEVEGVTHAPEGSVLPGSMRIWPHLTRGDGHFCVHLKKDENESADTFSLDKLPKYKSRRSDNYGFNKAREAYENFMKEILNCYKGISGEFVLHGNRIHIMPANERIFDGLKAVKLGDYPGEIKPTTTERLFIPSHSLALSLNASDIRPDALLSFARSDERLQRYLKGETVTVSSEERAGLKKKGHIVIAADGYPLGVGKISPDGSVKNLYPKAWRIL